MLSTTDGHCALALGLHASGAGGKDIAADWVDELSAGELGADEVWADELWACGGGSCCCELSCCGSWSSCCSLEDFLSAS